MPKIDIFCKISDFSHKIGEFLHKTQVFSFKTQRFSSKTQGSYPKLKVSEISGTCTAAESAKNKTLAYEHSALIFTTWVITISTTFTT